MSTEFKIPPQETQTKEEWKDLIAAYNNLGSTTPFEVAKKIQDDQRQIIFVRRMEIILSLARISAAVLTAYGIGQLISQTRSHKLNP